MTAASLELVRRLYLRLLDEGGKRKGGEMTELTVGDVYQNLVPYRSIRSELGVFELAEYEDALLRLLAGEGGYLRVKDEGARAELAAELRSANPILGIYRDYASLSVELLRPDDAPRPILSLHRKDEEQAPEEAEGPREEVRAVADFVDEESPLPLRPPTPVPADATRVAGHAPPASPPAPPRVSPAAPLPLREGEHRCNACDRPLPDLEGVRFCPHCGADQTAVPCERCGSPIRGEWNFCIRCGAGRPAPHEAP